jgi:hypothetical protein
MTWKNQHLLWLKTEYFSNQCLNQIPWSSGQSDSRMRFELQHLEVVDRNGLNLGHEHRTGMEVD